MKLLSLSIELLSDTISFEPIDKEAAKEQIFEVCGIRVMLDSDIAVYFGVETGLGSVI